MLLWILIQGAINQLVRSELCDSTQKPPVLCSNGLICTPEFVDCTTRGITHCLCEAIDHSPNGNHLAVLLEPGPVIIAPRRTAGAQRVGWDVTPRLLSLPTAGTQNSKLDAPGRIHVGSNSVLVPIMFSNLYKNNAQRLSFADLNRGLVTESDAHFDQTTPTHTPAATAGTSNFVAPDRPIEGRVGPVFFSVEDFVVELRRPNNQILRQQLPQDLDGKWWDLPTEFIPSRSVPHQLRSLNSKQNDKEKQQEPNKSQRDQANIPPEEAQKLHHQHLLQHLTSQFSTVPSSDSSDISLTSSSDWPPRTSFKTQEFHCEGDDLYYCNEHNNCEVQATCIHGCEMVAGRGAYCRIAGASSARQKEASKVSIKPEIIPSAPNVQQTAKKNVTLETLIENPREQAGFGWHGADVYCIDHTLYHCNEKKECSRKETCSHGCVFGHSTCNAVTVKTVTDQVRRAGRASRGGVGGQVSSGPGYCDSTAKEPQKCSGGGACTAQLLDCVTKGPQKCICGSKPPDGL